ncbi:MAG: hypothetical protein AB1941_05160 [Gemmatimonadota bacterium]
MTVTALTPAPLPDPDPGAPIVLQWQRTPWLAKNPEPLLDTPARRRGWRASINSRRARLHRDLGMFARFAPEEETFDARLERLNRQRTLARAVERKRHADNWRAARARFRALPRSVQRTLAEAWNLRWQSSNGPAELEDHITQSGYPTPEHAADRAVLARIEEKVAARSRRAARERPWRIRHVECDGTVDRCHNFAFHRAWECDTCGATWQHGDEAREAAERGELEAIDRSQIELQFARCSPSAV